MQEDRRDDGRLRSELTRRRFISAGAQGALAIGGAGLIAACGGSSSTTSAATNSGGGKPVAGGTLNVGMITAGTAETINPAMAVNNPDLLRIAQLYDNLFTVGANVELVPALALSAEPNKSATVWTLKLRPDVKWHDGTAFGANDVVWTLRSWANPNSNAHGQVANLVDFNAVRAVDQLTVEVPLVSAAGQFPSVLSFNQQCMLKEGSSSAQLNHNPIGTGPFKFVSFTPGQQSVFVRNPDYWQAGKPYVDKLVVNSSFADETSRNNALLSGAIHVSPILPPLVAKSLESSSEATLLRLPSVVQYWFLMRVDQGPFADNRIRQAMKLIADRPALVDGALAGYGTVANDLLGVDTQYYASDLPQRQQDIEQAKSLLKQAGQENFTFTLPTCNALPGFNPSATLFAQQAAEAGVRVNVQVVSADTYYTNSGGFLKRPIGLDYGAPFQSLSEVYRTFLTPGAPFNETWWGHQPGGAAAWALIDSAISAADATKAQELWHEVQVQQYDQGGILGWTNSDDLAGVAHNVRGVSVGHQGYMNYYRLTDAWLT
jgi:peptide/nickel transport system substrate-binding protein